MTPSGRRVAIVQARVGSTRLPGKVLMPLDGRPMVEHVLRRAAAIPGVEEVVAAIPEGGDDDRLEAAVRAIGFRIVRGPEFDVLERYALAAEEAGADVIVRITADCPMLSPSVAGRVLATLDGSDYASNTLERTFPRGLDAEAVTRAALDAARREAADPAEREHVTPFIYRRPDRFALRQVTHDVDLSSHRWTVDTPDDMAFASAVYRALGSSFELEDVLRLIEKRPELAAINQHSRQKPLGR